MPVAMTEGVQRERRLVEGGGTLAAPVGLGGDGADGFETGEEGDLASVGGGCG